MAGKCEHGLTTKECMVCASPKYPGQSSEPWITIPRARLAELESLDGTVDDLAMLVRRLVRGTREAPACQVAAEQAMDYLRRIGKDGSPMRADA